MQCHSACTFSFYKTIAALAQDGAAAAGGAGTPMFSNLMITYNMFIRKLMCMYIYIYMYCIIYIVYIKALYIMCMFSNYSLYISLYIYIYIDICICRSIYIYIYTYTYTLYIRRCTRCWAWWCSWAPCGCGRRRNHYQTIIILLLLLLLLLFHYQYYYGMWSEIISRASRFPQSRFRFRPRRGSSWLFARFLRKKAEGANTNKHNDNKT